MKIIPENDSAQFQGIVLDVSNQTFFKFNQADKPLTQFNPVVGLPLTLQEDLAHHWITRRDLQEEYEH